MTNISLPKYSLFIWEDYIKDINQDYFYDRKIAVLASDQIQDESSAYNINLKENVNGEKTLTFNLIRKIRDEQGNLIDNPFLSLLTSERTIKLRDGEDYKYNDISELEEEDTEEKWKDFIIKSIEEDKDTYVNTYICKESSVNELGKNGWSVILDTELENNYGTLIELGNKVLDGSGWNISDDSYNPVAKVNEQLFVAQVSSGFELLKIIDNSSTSIKAQDFIYLFYSDLENSNGSWVCKNQDSVQVMFAGNNKKFSTDLLDDDNVIIDYNNQYNYETNYSNLQNLVFYPVGDFNDPTKSSRAIRGGKIIKTVSSHYEPVAKKYVEDWQEKDTGNKVYSYIETEYAVSDIVSNFITNSNNFVSQVGWYYGNSITSNDEFIFHTMEIPEEIEDQLEWNPTNYLVLPNKTNILRNEGPSNQHISLVEGNLYVIRWKARLIDKNANLYTDETIKTSGGPTVTASLGYMDSLSYQRCTTKAKISNFKKETTSISSGGDKELYGYPIITEGIENRKPWSDSYIDIITEEAKEIYTDEQGYAYAFLRATTTTELYEKIYFALEINGDSSDTYCWHIKDIQIFEYKEQTINDKKIPIFIGDTPEGTAIQTRIFYNVIDTSNGKEIQNLSSDINKYSPIIKEGYPAVRHLETKESNYFNILNNLAELFEVWVRFRIKHKKNGQFLRKEDGSLIKEVIFSQFSPNNRENQAGFKYGINLKNIKRTTDSSNIVTKLIVKDNENTFATDGLCSIKRAKENPTGENTIINFDYYINQNLLEYNQYLSDMYGLLDTNLSYIPTMKQYNEQLLPLNQLLIEYNRQIQEADDMLEYIDTSIDSANEELLFQQKMYDDFLQAGIGDNTLEQKKIVIAQLKAKILTYESSKESYEIQKDFYNTKIYGAPNKEAQLLKYVGIWKNTEEYKQHNLVMFINKDHTIKIYESLIDKNNSSIDETKNWQEFTNIDSLGIEDQINILSDKKKYLNTRLFKKYNRFIQEGTWIDNNYIDDDLYYFDAVKVSSQNAYPKATYTIDVVDLSNSNEFSEYTFNIGEKTYIEDTEYFGYEYREINNVLIKVPYKKEAVITERTRIFDNPANSSIKIQTYKNYFEELFSKMADTTSKFQYSSGGYDRAANTIKPNGEIDVSSLENAMANNSWILANSNNQNVIWDSGKGIIVTDRTNSSVALRITSNGIAMTTDGGNTWINGITGMGINTRYLVAGQIDASKINITDSSGYAFKWDSKGLSAYGNGIKDEEGAYTETQFVRFNKYGLFGTTKGITLEEKIKELDNREVKPSIDEYLKVIEDNSNFSLSWNGLNLKYQDGSVSLNPMNGLEIYGTDRFNEGTEKDPGILMEYPYIVKPDGSLYKDGDLIPLVSLGKFKNTLEDSQDYYGLRMRNNSGYITLTTNNDGNLWLKETLTLGSLETVENNIETEQRDVYIYAVKNEDNNQESYIYFTFYAKDIYVNEDGDIRTTNINIPFLQQSYTLKIKEESALVLETVSENIVTIDSSNDVYNRYTAYITNTDNSLDNFTEGYYPVEFDTQLLACNYLELNGNINGDQNLALYVGGKENIANIPSPNLKIYSTGKIIANNGEFSGTINALQGNFLGYIKIGEKSGISGETLSPYTFWAGKLNNQEYGQPTFYVTENGELNCSNAYLRGTFYAEDGYIKKLFFDGQKRSYIGSSLDENQDILQQILISINNGAFNVSGNGDMYANSLFLSKNSLWNSEVLKDNYNISINDANNIFTVFDPSRPSKDTIIFNIDSLGSVQMNGNLYMNGSLNTNQDLVFNGRLTSKDRNFVIDGKNGSIYSGTNWSINGIGDAYFNNVTIRGAIKSAVFEYDKISSIGGELFISPSLYLTKDINKTSINDNEEGYVLFDNYNNFEDSVSILSGIEEAELWTKITTVLINIPNEENDLESTIKYTQKDNENNVKNIKVWIPAQSYNKEVLEIGTQIISKSTESNFIKITAKNINGSSIIVSSQNKKDFTILGYINLLEIDSSSLFHSYLEKMPPQTGLYAENAYITGKLFLPNAGITNEEESNLDESVRIWAGADADNKNNAPFRVTHDGSLYANKGIFRGKVEAIDGFFNGKIQAAGVEILEKNPYDNHFYFIKDQHNNYDNMTYDDYIIDINKNGINIWEGGLNIYSDYYSGYRNEIFNPELINNIYGMNPNNIYNPNIMSYPIMTILDKSVNSNFIPRVSLTDMQLWKKDNNLLRGILLSSDGICFKRSISSNINNGYKEDAESLYTSEDILSIKNDNNSPSFYANNLYFMTSTGENIYHYNIDGVEINKKLIFDKSIEITQDEYGIVFNYIGREDE